MSSLSDVMAAPKKHQARKSGPKADKKVKVDKKKRGLSNEKHNPKAFSVANIGRTQKGIQRNLDRAQKKEVVPLVNRTEDTPPPTMVVVMGPRGCGKTTLIRSLVKVYTNQNLTDTKGPITVICGKKKRVTFFECPSDDIYAMADLAKIADLVLLLVDASFGYEMETFEFLNLLQLHGFPKVVGILTHLDGFQQNKRLQNNKKTLKHRFWTEIYKGAKMFDMTSLTNTRYPKVEVKRLSLYISRIKYRPLTWRNTHPFMAVDRVEDITPSYAQNSEEREIALYGFIRGTHLKSTMKVHLIGAGDFDMESMTQLDDPIPMTGTTNTAHHSADGKKEDIRKSLRRKDSLLYAPMSNIGNVTMDKDGVYIELKNVNYTKKEFLQLGDRQRKPAPVGGMNGSGVQLGGPEDYESEEEVDLGDTPAGLLRSMQDIKHGVDYKMKNAELSLFKNSGAVSALDAQDSDDEEDDDDMSDNDEDEEDDEEDDEEMSGSENDDDLDEEEEDDMSDDGEDDDQSMDEDEEDDDEEDDEEDDDRPFKVNKSGKLSTSAAVTKSADYNEAAWKHGMQEKANQSFLDRAVGRRAGGGRVVKDWMSIVYGNDWRQHGGMSAAMEVDGHSNNQRGGNGSSKPAESDDSDSDDDLFKPKSTAKVSLYERNNMLNSNRYQRNEVTMKKWRDALEALKNAKLEASAAASAVDADESAEEEESDNDDEDDDEDDEEDSMDGSDDEDDDDSENDDSENGDGDDDDDSMDDEEEEEESFSDEEDEEMPRSVGGKSNSKPVNKAQQAIENSLIQRLKQRCFVTGNWKAVGSTNISQRGAAGDEEYGDLEDLEASKAKEQESDNESDLDMHNDNIDEMLRLKHANKKGAAKAKFDEDYDAEKTGRVEGKKGTKMSLEEAEEDKYLEQIKKQMEVQKLRNQKEFGEEGEQSRLQLEGVRQGLYVRIVLKGIPKDFTDNFNSSKPVIVGGLLPHETTMGFVRARVKRHRWHRRVLKSHDPLIFSIGWRRYQSIPIYSMEQDTLDRQRFMKYTPEHMHCNITFWGPLVPPNTGILAIQKPEKQNAQFRIALTGTTLELVATPTVVKKLKLTGTPNKIFKNTAFITGMFNSALEVAKYEGAKLKTVSGIRGQVKKAMNDGTPGRFRASFEDKILMSDIIICRIWVDVAIKQFYNPVTSLLTDQWQAMKHTAMIRQDRSIPIPVNKDSVYKPIEREEKIFKKLAIPKKLQEALPFASKPKQQVSTKGKPMTYMQRRAVIAEPEDRSKRAFVQMLGTLKNEKVALRTAKNKERSEKNLKDKQRQKDIFEPLVREEKKRKYKADGKEEARKANPGGRGSKRSKRDEDD